MITNPTPQRALRGHRPERPRPRLAASGEYTARLAARLTERDRWLAHMLHEHKVLTSSQIAALAWPSLRAANLRLLQLYTWRVIDRFQPFVTYGTAPMHYVLDVAGAAILAREEGIEPAAFNFAGSPVSLRLLRSRSLVCEVSDGSLTTPRIRRAALTDEGGRGLQLVAALSRRWGTRYVGSGKCIWSEQDRATA